MDSLLDGFSGPVPYVRDNVLKAPQEPGVHVVFGPPPDDGVIYVGHTAKQRERMLQHLSGDREASVLYEQVGELLDGDEPGSATREQIQAWLGTCQVAWILTDDRIDLKRRLIERHQPRFNRQGVPDDLGDADSGIWWVNQRRSYEAERSGWVIFAGTVREDNRQIAHHQILKRLRPGDVTLHYADGALRAIGIVHAAAVKCRRPHGPIASRDLGLAVRVEYFPLDAPLPLDQLPGERESIGPFDKNSGVRQGYCFEVPSGWAERLRSQGPKWPAGSPWAEAERRHWVFQAQPDQWDLVEHLPEMLPGTDDTWTATKNRKRMQDGDSVVLWSGGAQAGAYALARLTGQPVLAPVPDFRPDTAGDEEHRVPLVVTAHLIPPLLKAAVRAHPDLEGLSVLHTPWAGTNQPITASEWRAIVASMPMEEPMNDGWDGFVHWARRLADGYDLDTSERQYKLDLSALLATALAAFRSGDPWIEPLRQAVNHQNSNMLNWRIKSAFLGWVKDEPDAASLALGRIWDELASPGESVEAFAELLPTTVATGAGTRANLASFLRIGLDPTVNPVVKPKSFRHAFELVGFPSTSLESERTRYEDGVRFLDTFIDEASTRGFKIGDRLDAQGLVWAVTSYKPAPGWADPEQQAFLAYRAGHRSGPSDDHLAHLVFQFRQETGYPVEGDPQRDREREEMATGLTPAALDAPDLTILRRMAGPAYGSPGPQPGWNTYLQSDDTVERAIDWLRSLLHGPEPVADRINAALTGPHALPKVKEAMAVKALAVSDPDRWIPNYVTEGPVGKRRVLEALGLPSSPANLTKAAEVIDANDRIRHALEPHFADDPWGMQEFTWWLLHRDATPPDPVDAIERLAKDLLYPREFIEKTLRLIAHKTQVVFYGPPGTGKTYYARALAEHLAAGGGTVETVQFHPSYSYEDFVEGYRPRTVDGHLSYEVVDGPLKRIALTAAQRQDVTHVLIIDEFNRALVSKVLGELYFLLEYRGVELRLQYSDTPFTLPKNLVILATMNTADRSIALVDAALRRRFHFVGLYPDQEPVKGLLQRFLDKYKLLDELGWLPGAVDRANALARDRHLALGPSHFLDTRLTEEQVELIWEHSVMPYFEEQFLDDPDQLRLFELSAVRSDGAATIELPGEDPESEVDDEDLELGDATAPAD